MTKPKVEAVKVGPLRVAAHVRDGVSTGKWMVDLPPHVAPDGKRKRLFLASKAAATAEAKRMLRELQLDGAIRGHGRKVSGVTFSELSQRWLTGQADRVATNKKRKISLETHAFRLKALLAQLGSKDVLALGAPEVIAYQKARMGEGKSPATVNSETRLLRQILAWACDHNLVPKVPKVEPIPEPRKRLVVPTTDEVLAILTHLPPRTALLVRFLAETGCRKGEAFALEWADLDHANSLVMVRRKHGFTPKTDHSDRDVHIARPLLAALLNAKAEADKQAKEDGAEPPRLVFPGRGGGRMWNFEKALATAIKKAGVTRGDAPMHINPHLFRKAHVTWLKQRGTDDSLLQPRIGHAPGSRVTAHNYVHLPTAALRATVVDLDRERARKVRQAARRVAKKGASGAPDLATNGNTA